MPKSKTIVEGANRQTNEQQTSTSELLRCDKNPITECNCINFQWFVSFFRSIHLQILTLFFSILPGRLFHVFHWKIYANSISLSSANRGTDEAHKFQLLAPVAHFSIPRIVIVAELPSISTPTRLTAMLNNYPWASYAVQRTSQSSSVIVCVHLDRFRAKRKWKLKLISPVTIPCRRVEGRTMKRIIYEITIGSE